MKPAPWMEQAKCNTMPAELFDWRPNFEHTEPARAKALCAGCPVLQQCARFAHQIRPSDTIYAGIAFPPMGRGMRKGPARRAYEQLTRLIGQSDTHCRNGHEWAENIAWKKKSNGTRVRWCRQCQRDSVNRSAAKRRAAAA